MRHNRYEAIDFQSERRKLFKLYRHTSALRRRRNLEQRIMNSLGFFEKSDARYPFFTAKTFYRVD